MNRKQKRRKKVMFQSVIIAIGAVLVILFIVSIGVSTCIVGSVATSKKVSKVEAGEKQKTNSAEQTESDHMMKMKGISQEDIPTGCEAVSAVTALNYLGIEISPEEFINEFLEKEPFYYMGDKMYGADPEEKFAGNPYDRFSLGCFPPVIAEGIEKMKACGYEGSENIDVKIMERKSFDDMCKGYVANDIPVLIWITIDMSEPKTGTSYYLEDGTRYTWMFGEHCMVLCGYDNECYYFKDSLSQGETVKYEKSLVELRYEQMGSRALAVFRVS